MKVVDIANHIFIEVGEPTTTTIPAIAFWVRGKVGWLNAILYEGFYVDEATQEVLNADKGNAEISPEAVAVLIQNYKVYDLEGQIRNMLNAISLNGIIEVQDNLAGTSFKRINRSEVLKTLVQLKKDEVLLLHDMIATYQSLMSNPSQVAGDDTQPGYSELFPSYRPFWTRIGVYGRY